MRRVLACSLLVFAWIVSCADQTNPSFPPPSGTLPDGGEEASVDGGDVDGGSATVTGDPARGVLLEGTVIGESGPYDGQVLVTPDGLIACAEPGDACSKEPAADGVAHVVTNGVIAPGLIDTHNHILFDFMDDSDWLPSQLYTNHNQWTKETLYGEMVDVKQCLEDASQGKPTWCPAHFDGAGNLKCELDKWGELKGLVAGTTSIVGLPGVALPCFGSVARTIDTQFNGLDSDKVQTSSLFPPSQSSGDGVCSNYTSGKTSAYLIHCGEGLPTDDTANAEFGKLGSLTTTPECLYAPGTAITHGTAFSAADFATMAAHQMKLVWSPASNVALYGDTTNVPAALDAGVLVALAPDWSMGGSQNLLDELRFAKKWSDTKWGGRLTTKDLVTMTTVNAATVLGLQDKLGTIKAGYVADIFVVRGDRKAPYDAIVAATPREVVLTMVGGKALYGDASIRAVGYGGPLCEDFDACGAGKFLCVAVPGASDNKLDQKYAQIKAALESALTEIDQVKPQDGHVFSPVAPIVACAK